METLAVIVIVLLAIFYLTMAFRKKAKRKGGFQCGGNCTGCKKKT